MELKAIPGAGHRRMKMKETVMKRGLAGLAGAGLGAVAMYYLDPDKGKRRRALLQDKVTRTVSHVGDTADVTRRDLLNRTRGLAANMRSVFRRRPVSDELLVEHIRAKIGRVVTHPHAIHVSARDGTITLTGPILQHEVPALVSCVKSVAGVRHVDNLLAAHETAGNIPGLQGEGRLRAGDLPEWRQENWAPATQFLVGLPAALLALFGLRTRGVSGTAMTVLGGGMLARAVSNKPFYQLLGLRGRNAVYVQKDIYIDAPVEKVFQVWSNYDNFPEFMKHVRAVHQTGENRSHWEVAGPMGTTIVWEAVRTMVVPNQEICWETLPGGSVAHEGVVRFDPLNHGTRIDIKMSYTPMAGALGHVVAALFGTDPKSELDADLVRLKTWLETGKPAHDAAAHARSHSEGLSR